MALNVQNGMMGEVIVENSCGQRIKIRDFGVDGLHVTNESKDSQAVYKSKKDRRVFVFADAQPKSFWKEYFVCDGTCRAEQPRSGTVTCLKCNRPKPELRVVGGICNECAEVAGAV